MLVAYACTCLNWAPHRTVSKSTHRNPPTHLLQDPPKLVPSLPSEDLDDPTAASAQSQRRATFNASLECCKELVTRCPANAQVAVSHGVVSIATTYIATHLNPPPNPAALRLLYQLVVCKEYCEEIYETMTSCLTIPALARLLDAALVHAGPEDRGTQPWLPSLSLIHI